MLHPFKIDTVSSDAKELAQQLAQMVGDGARTQAWLSGSMPFPSPEHSLCRESEHKGILWTFEAA